MSPDLQPDDELDAAVHRADLDELIRLIDRRTQARDWSGLSRTRRSCAAAVDTGRQLWPAATLAEYRLALWAPDEWCATVMEEDAGRFTPGPLSEVAAVHHTWENLSPHLAHGPLATYFAHERSLRGERIPASDQEALVPVIDIPIDLQTWEPTYGVATYDDDGAHHDRPTRTKSMSDIDLPVAPAPLDDPETTLAFAQLVEMWTEKSNGRSEVTCVEGSAIDAISATGARRARSRTMSTHEALDLLLWAGSSGGAHGRRRGAATGRFSVWWLLAALVDCEWSEDLREFSLQTEQLRWMEWDAWEPATGWELRLAVEHPASGVSWSFTASDVD